MKNLTSNEIRQMWLDFFSEKLHKIEESASLIPNNDPTLLWINAGVAALKKYFDGSEKPQNPRIVNSQKCIRTNDIENVGMTARHHTMFEMLGNFSIGDYFKEDAIAWAMELLFDEKWFGFDIDKVYMTVYPSDTEAKKLWLSHGIKENHIIESDYNYWEIGEGPCGPCSEVFFDRGSEYGDFTTDAIRDDVENDRYIEIWNIVFSQFNSKPGLSREEYPELPQKNIDTGAGLERITCLLQNVETNYETDLFLPTIKRVEELSGVKYTGQVAFKVISDHVRTVTFAIADGAILSNEGRGYVLRRVLRRAVKHARSLGFTKPFMFDLVDIVIENMGKHYSYLHDKVDIIKKVIKTEEEKFFETLDKGLKLIESLDSTEISGAQAFKLYDTFGFPIELTVEYAEENGLKVDVVGFKEEMEIQRNRARNARTEVESMGTQNEDFLNFEGVSTFVGYDSLEVKTEIIGVFGDKVVLCETPFYAESGGQVADVGLIGDVHVSDVQKMPNGQFIHTAIGHSFKVGSKVTATVDTVARNLTTYNHSATHLLFKVLRDELGSHVSQSGSNVSSTNLRFDFNNYDPLTDEQIITIESKVNEVIKQGLTVTVTEESIDKAKEMGAIAEFGEKYGDLVRVVNMDNFTIDLCGGTHVSNVDVIEKLAITSVESKGSGIYRVEALTNKGVDNISDALQVYNNEIMSLLNKADNVITDSVKKGLVVEFNYEIEKDYLGSYLDIMNKRNELTHVKELVKNLDKKVQKELQSLALSDLSVFDEFIDGSSLVAHIKGYDPKVLKQIVDSLLDKLGNGVVFIANEVNGKIVFVAKSNNGVHCGNLVKEAAIICGGNGGGRPDLAQAGGKDVTKIAEAIKKVKELI